MIQLFLQHFVIHIQHITIPDNHNASIGFLVTCKLNKRSKYFHYILPKHIVTSSPNTHSLIDHTWKSLKNTILQWASKTFYLPKQKLNYYPFTPLITPFHNFNSLYTTYITQFKTLLQQPHSVIIKFLIIYNVTQSSKYFKTTIPIHTSHNIQQDIQSAWNQLQNNILLWTHKHTHHPPLLNPIYTPNPNL